MEKPEQIKDVDLTKLLKVCQDYLDFHESEEYHEDNDYDHYIFEEAMEAFFGKGVWIYLRSKTQ